MENDVNNITMKNTKENKKIHKRTFTMGEISHIVNVLMENEREGWYYGNKEQYWKRQQSILDKLFN